MTDIRTPRARWQSYRFMFWIPVVGLGFVALLTGIALISGSFVWDEWRLPLSALLLFWVAITALFGAGVGAVTLVQRRGIKRTLADPWAVWYQHTPESWAAFADAELRAAPADGRARRRAQLTHQQRLAVPPPRAVLSGRGLHNEDSGFVSLRALRHVTLTPPEPSGGAVLTLITTHSDDGGASTHPHPVRVPPGAHPEALQVLERYGTERRRVRTTVHEQWQMPDASSEPYG